LKKANKVVLANIGDQNFNAQKFADLMYLSYSQVYRKINALTGKSITEFIRIAKMAHGRDLLIERNGNVSEVAYKIGLSPSYFSKVFKKIYGCSPTRINGN